MDICHVFQEHGYCTLGDGCTSFHARTQSEIDTYGKELLGTLCGEHDSKQDHLEADEKVEKVEKVYADVTEICFSFDTTGSMSCYLEQVTNSLKQIVKDLFAKIPNIRIAIIAHGDYCDAEFYYVLKSIDFTRDQHKLFEFVKNAGGTGGGDEDECYEFALWHAAHKLNWTKNARSKALVVIGDASPHEPDYPLNKKKINWRTEVDLLRMQECRVYGVFCGESRNRKFYKEIASKTGGEVLDLTSIKHICKLFVALCLKTSDDDALFEQYKNEVLRSHEGDDELNRAMQTLAGMQRTARKSGVTCQSAVKRLMYDLKEIQREDLQYIAVVPDEASVFEWHVNIRPIQGTLKGVYIHLLFTFPADYPSAPPSIKLASRFPDGIHANIEDACICLPLFGADNYDSDKGKFGSSWSAAYSIVSLLINVESIFGEIGGAGDRPLNHSRSVNTRTAAKLLAIVRGTNCKKCGHSQSTPYPVLGANKLPFELLELNVNEQHFKHILQAAMESDNKKLQSKIVSVERKHRQRGVLIAGNIIETVKTGKLWPIKSQRGIHRAYHDTVSWSFIVDRFERNKSLHSLYMFGFVDEANVFFGVDCDGNIIHNNKSQPQPQQQQQQQRIRAHCTVHYVLHFGDDADTLFVFINYRHIASIVLPAASHGKKCPILFPVMYVQDIRLRLSLNHDPKLQQCIAKLQQLPFETVEAFNALQSNYAINTRDGIESVCVGGFYTDQCEWNELLERALSSDVLLSIFSLLSYCDLVHCKEVNSYWYLVLSGHNILDRTEMRCFYTREGIEDDRNSKCILGVGLHVVKSSNKWISKISTEMDFLSLSAYKDYNICAGAWSEEINFFLPLVINEKHAERARKAILHRINMIAEEKTFRVQHALMVVTAIMNSFVVQLMANTIGMEETQSMSRRYQQRVDPKIASEKALVGYCAFHHLLLWLADNFPEIKEHARKSIEQFIKDPEYRTKKETPDLGKFLLNLAIVDEYSWQDLNDAFVHESLDRQVKWYVDKFPTLAYLDDAKCSPTQRLALTVKSTVISRKLVIFQVFFLSHVCKQSGRTLTDILHDYNTRWGRPTEDQKRLLMKAVQSLLLKHDTINSWLDYFHTLKIAKLNNNAQVCTALKKAVVNSKNKQYHGAKAQRMHGNGNGRKRVNRRRSTTAVKTTMMQEEMFAVQEANLHVSDAEVIEYVGVLQGHRAPVTCIKVVPTSSGENRIVSGSRDKSAVVWKYQQQVRKSFGGVPDATLVEGAMTKRLSGHNHFVSDLDISADGRYAITASWDRLLRLYCIDTGRLCRKFVGHSKDVLAVRFSADNRVIVSAGMDNAVCIWNTLGVLQQRIERAHHSWITGLQCSNCVDGSFAFVTVAMDKIVKVWHYDETQSMYTVKHALRGHTAAVCCVAVSPDDSLCATGDKYGNVLLWDLDAGKLITTLEAISARREISCIRFSPSRYWLSFTVADCVEIWELEEKKNVGILRKGNELDIASRKTGSTIKNLNCIEWSIDGKTLFVGQCNHEIAVWKLSKNSI